MVIRNGCAGGVFKEVLDYVAQKTNQVNFNSHQQQDAQNNPAVNTTFQNNLGQASNQNDAFTMITPASVSSFVTNTVTADEKKRQNIIATRSGVAGTGY